MFSISIFYFFMQNWWYGKDEWYYYLSMISIYLRNLKSLYVARSRSLVKVVSSKVQVKKKAGSKQQLNACPNFGDERVELILYERLKNIYEFIFISCAIVKQSTPKQHIYRQYRH